LDKLPQKPLPAAYPLESTSLANFVKLFFDVIYETTVTASVKMLANTLIAALNMQKSFKTLTPGSNVIKLLKTNFRHYRHNLSQSHKRGMKILI
jgi:hypothetical protein